MNKYFLCVTLLLGISYRISAQNEIWNTDTIAIQEVVVKANSVPVSLKNNPGSVSLVIPGMLSDLPKSITYRV